MIADKIDPPVISEQHDGGPPLVADLLAINAMLRAKLAAYEGVAQPVVWAIFKNAVTDTGIPRENLRRWCKAGLVQCYVDENDDLFVNTTDANRYRFEHARRGG